jgi:metal-responsive CopG/Arc/MetJ family transcriptional regulator
MESFVDMKTIQMTINEELLRELDRTIEQMKITRSAFIRESIVYYLKRKKILEMEKQHKAGYEKKPVREDEFGIWEDEQVWGD